MRLAATPEISASASLVTVPSTVGPSKHGPEGAPRAAPGMLPVVRATLPVALPTLPVALPTLPVVPATLPVVPTTPPVALPTLPVVSDQSVAVGDAEDVGAPPPHAASATSSAAAARVRA
ncbi:MAG: hypothetical protein OHK0013_28640 [Sandaracinaceae bacterium]